MMTRQQFDDALNRYGGDLAKWPTALRAGAEHLSASDAQAASQLAALRNLEGRIASAVRPQPLDAASIGRITSLTQGKYTDDVAIRPTVRLASWAGAATVAALIIGFVAGISVPQDLGEESFAGLMFGGSAFEESVGSIL